MSKIKVNDEQMDLFIGKTADIYHKLTLDLFDNVVSRLRVRGTADLVKTPYIWQLEKMNDMHLLNEENIKLIVERSGIAEEVFRDVIENEGYKVYKDTKEQLAEDMAAGPTTQNYTVQNALSAYYSQTMLEMDNLINTTLPQSVRDVYQSIVEESVAKVATGMYSTYKALNETVMKWFDKGFYGFTDKGGKQWKADVYARTVIKSTVRRVFQEMRERPARELGIDTFYYSIKASAREMCAPLQNQIVTTGQTRIIEGQKVISVLDYGYGTPGGCRGINCGHTMTPFIVGVNEKPDLPEKLKNLTPEQAIENANIESKQRALERQIRQNKERLHVAKELDDRELIDKYKLRGKTLDMAMKDHLDKNDFLVRLKEREKLFKNNESLSNTRKWMEADFKKRYNNFNDKLTDKITEKQFKDLTSHDLNRIKEVMLNNEELGNRLKLKEFKQKEHIYGTEEYNNRNNGQSYFKDITERKLYNYMLKNMDMKKIYQKYQFINTDGINGVHILPSGQNINSNQIKMHQSKGGIHGVPNAKKR
ncbi:phage minor capsid protein [Eremococcus coleocola]|uniref:phage minor capsid protein n=1 Tax=Eremococcus coleocola TaxID=88132 RepID=UPI000403C09B|nr:phage minor capsid protein [Eremococcus coleocola]